jgi:hypothetical protein
MLLVQWLCGHHHSPKAALTAQSTPQRDSRSSASVNPEAVHSLHARCRAGETGVWDRQRLLLVVWIVSVRVPGNSGYQPLSSMAAFIRPCSDISLSMQCADALLHVPAAP